MRNFSSLPLDDDVIDQILRFLPTFAQLQATIFACKAFYAVFRAHPRSIVLSIAQNEIGPVPEALKLIRCPMINPQDDIQDFLPPIDLDSPINPEEARFLSQHARAVIELEDLFSMRHKDRASNLSKLTSIESLRFRRGMYRLMLYSRLFNHQQWDVDVDDDEELRKIRAIQRSFLATFSSQELLELERVVAFVTELSQWTYHHLSLWQTGFADLALSTGPESLLSAFKDATSVEAMNMADDDDEHPLLQGFIHQPLSELWQVRKITPPNADSAEYKPTLLSCINGESDKCQHCNTTFGVNLWNETNWSFLKYIFPPVTTLNFKGLLSRNTWCMSTVANLMFEGYPVLLQEIFDDIQVLPPFDHLQKQSWLCATCVTELVNSHLHIWCLERLRRVGTAINPDCWYGYNCRTQVHRAVHASKLNHLCEPTK